MLEDEKKGYKKENIFQLVNKAKKSVIIRRLKIPLDIERFGTLDTSQSIKKNISKKYVGGKVISKDKVKRL